MIKYSESKNIRKIDSRWVFRTDLIVESAMNLGDVPNSASDCPVLMDSDGTSPLLLGSTLAGALRAKFEEVWGNKPPHIFGGAQSDSSGNQSPLIVYNSAGNMGNKDIEIRDGVKIDYKTGIAEDHKKYDFEVIPAGTIFPLRFDLIIPLNEKKEDYLKALFSVFKLLENAEIALGMKKSRGLGRVKAKNWSSVEYNFKEKKGWLAWAQSPYEGEKSPIFTLKEMVEKCGFKYDEIPSLKKNYDIVEMDMEIPGEVLIGAQIPELDAPDISHLTSGGVPIISGTSLAGVLRHHAVKVSKMAVSSEVIADTLVANIFGASESDEGSEFASKLVVWESQLKEAKPIRVTRVQIDRFTQGAVDHALFDEEVYSGGQFRLKLELKDPKPEESGLLLLLVKDLKDGMLSVGGTGSVGRGFMKPLKGGKAKIKFASENKEYSVFTDKADEIAIFDKKIKSLNSVKTVVSRGEEEKNVRG